MAGCSSTTPLPPMPSARPLSVLLSSTPHTCGLTLEHAHGLALSSAPCVGFRCVRFSSLRPLPGHRPSAASAPLSRHTHTWYLLCMMSVNRSTQLAMPSPASATPSNRTCATFGFSSFPSHHLMVGAVCAAFFFFLSFPRSSLRVSISHLPVVHLHPRRTITLDVKDGSHSPSTHPSPRATLATSVRYHFSFSSMLLFSEPILLMRAHLSRDDVRL